MRKLLTCAIIALLSITSSFAKEATPDETVTFKTTEQGELKLHIFYPEKKGKNRPLVISFYGGGWNGGAPSQFYQQSRYYASLGMVAITPEYRIRNTHNTTPFECVMDSKSAVRWARENAKRLGIDPKKIIVSGGSAGGHVAACTTLIEGCDDPTDNMKYSCKASAMILFNPVTDTTKEGYGWKKFVGRETEISPIHYINKNTPPTIIFHGTADTTVPFENSERFVRTLNDLGGEATLVPFFGMPHSFFNYREGGDRNYTICMSAVTQFLRDNGYINKNTPIPTAPKSRIACVGDSITYGGQLENPKEESYPTCLAAMVGERYDVRNFGASGRSLLSKSEHPYMAEKKYRDMIEFDPDVVFIMLGTNDSNSRNWIYKEDFESDYDTLIKSIKKASENKKYIYLCLPVAAFTAKGSKGISNTTIEEEIIPMIESVAKRNKVMVIDTHTPFLELGDLFPDKVHPNKKGAKILAETIYNGVNL